MPTFTRLAVEGFDHDGTPTRRVHVLSEHSQAELTAVMVAATTATLLETGEHCHGAISAIDLVGQSAAEAIITELAPRTRWVR